MARKKELRKTMMLFKDRF